MKGFRGRHCKGHQKSVPGLFLSLSPPPRIIVTQHSMRQTALKDRIQFTAIELNRIESNRMESNGLKSIGIEWSCSD